MSEKNKKDVVLVGLPPIVGPQPIIDVTKNMTAGNKFTNILGLVLLIVLWVMSFMSMILSFSL
jgi:hypothetical protein